MVALAAVMVAAGCQTPGRVVSVEKSEVCPMCEMEVVTTPIAGMTYTRHVCPSCKTVSMIDPAAPMSMRDYVEPGQETIHVCEHCQTAVSECPVCRAR